MLALVPNPRFASGSRLEPNLNHCNSFYPIKGPNHTEPEVIWLVPQCRKLWSLAPISISVLIISHYDIYIKDAILHALSPPIFQFAIGSIFVESGQKMPDFQWCSTATQRILIGLQLWEKGLKVHAKLHLLCIYHIVIRSELKYLIGAKHLSSRKWGSTVCKSGQKTAVVGVVGVWNRSWLGGDIPCRFQSQTWATVPAPTQTSAGQPETVASNSWKHSRSKFRLYSSTSPIHMWSITLPHSKIGGNNCLEIMLLVSVSVGPQCYSAGHQITISTERKAGSQHSTASSIANSLASWTLDSCSRLVVPPNCC